MYVCDMTMHHTRRERLQARHVGRHGMSLLLLIALLSVLLVPVGVGAQVDPPVRDFTDIQAGEVNILTDPAGTLATIEVSTTIDAACAVVFGEDETFGRLGTDVDMAAGGHRDHRVVLGGLEPGTVYLFRLQGSSPDGDLYRSQVYSFRTPMPSTTTPEDLAIGATIVAVSSEFSTAFAAVNAVDGDRSTEWSSSGDGDDAFITLDLERVVDVTAVAFRTRQMSDGTAITQTFTVTVDGIVLGSFPAGPDPVPVEASAQVMRFDIETSSGGNTGAAEIEVYGTVPATP